LFAGAAGRLRGTSRAAASHACASTVDSADASCHTYAHTGSRSFTIAIAYACRQAER
jgi:hypothetical protein